MKNYTYFFLLALILGGCNSSGNDNKKITFKSISVSEENSGLVSGIPFKISSVLNCESDFEGEKRVSFFLLRNSVKEESEEIADEIEDSFYLGDYILTGAKQGDFEISIEAAIPLDVDESGHYYIGGRVCNTSDEIDEYEDVFQSDEFYLDNTKEEIANIVLTDFQLESSKVLLDENEKEDDIDPNADLDEPYHGNTEIFANLTVNVFNKKIESFNIHVQIYLNGQWCNLELFDSDEDKFVEQLNVKPKLDQENQVIALDINIPEALVNEIYNEALANDDNSFTLRATADLNDYHYEVNEEDNFITSRAEIYVFPDKTPAGIAGVKLLEKAYSPFVGSRTIAGAGVEMEFKTGAYTVPPRGVASARFKLSPAFLGSNIGLAQVDINGQLGAIPSDRGIVLGVKWQGKKMKEMSLFSSLTKEWENDWYKENDFFHGRVFIVGVPINFSTGAKGGIGYKFNLGLTDKLYVNGRFPNIDLGIYGRGGIDFVAAEAGVEINGVLAEVDTAATAEVTLDILSAGIAAGSSLARADILGEFFYMVNILGARIGLYLLIPEVKWCKKWGVSYPCGVKLSRPYYYWFYESPKAFEKKATLLNKKITWK
jgi:hypothetical protein